MTSDLTVQDLTGIVQLLAGVEGEGVAGRRQHLMVKLAKLIEAPCWYWTLMAGTRPDRDPAPLSIQSGGWHSPEQQARVVSAYHSPAGMLLHAFFRQRFGQHATCTRSDLCSEERWFASDFYRQYLQPTGFEDLLVSAYPVNQDMVSGVAFFRMADAGPFTPRERALVHLVTEQVQWMHRGPTDLPVARTLPSLSLRCREVLVHLLSGDSRKQIAKKLHRSENTIADSIKTLYRQLGVSSRGELLARFLAGGRPTELDGVGETGQARRK